MPYIIMPKVSIILTVYNAGKYLYSCMDTLINQSLKDIEIIIVTDCPTDGSDVIVEKYASRDSRIKVIKNGQNLHIGESRNRGLEIASGEYIAFSDHDDYRELDMYERLYLTATKKNADLVIGTSVCDTEGEITQYPWPSNLTDNATRDFVLRDLIGQGNLDRPWPLGTNIHPNLYKREILIQNNIKFVNTKNIVPEDRLFNIATTLASGKIIIDRGVRYYHRIIRSSEMHNRSYYEPKKRIRYWDNVYDLLKGNKVLQAYEKNFAIGVQKNFLEYLYLALFSYRSWSRYRGLLDLMRVKPYCKWVFSFPIYSLTLMEFTRTKIFMYRYFAYMLRK